MTDIKELLPLAGVFTAVAVLTLVFSFWRQSFLLGHLMKSFMGFFFLVFGSFKIYNLEGFREAFESYDPLAERIKAYSLVYPFIEFALGLSFLALVFTSILYLEILVLAAAISVMVLNASGVFHALYAGKDLQCACLGNVFNVPMTWVTLGEDLLMAGMAIWMLIGVV